MPILGGGVTFCKTFGQPGWRMNPCSEFGSSPTVPPMMVQGIGLVAMKPNFVLSVCVLFIVGNCCTFLIFFFFYNLVLLSITHAAAVKNVALLPIFFLLDMNSIYYQPNDVKFIET